MDNDVIKMAQIENMITVVVCGAVVVSLAVIFKNLNCLWGLLILLNYNNFFSRKEN